MDWFLGFVTAVALAIAFIIGGAAGIEVGRKDERRWRVFSADCVVRGMSDDDCRRAWNMEDSP